MEGRTRIRDRIRMFEELSSENDTSTVTDTKTENDEETTSLCETDEKEGEENPTPEDQDLAIEEDIRGFEKDDNENTFEDIQDLTQGRVELSKEKTSHDNDSDNDNNDVDCERTPLHEKENIVEQVEVEDEIVTEAGVSDSETSITDKVEEVEIINDEKLLDEIASVQVTRSGRKTETNDDNEREEDQINEVETEFTEENEVIELIIEEIDCDYDVSIEKEFFSNQIIGEYVEIEAEPLMEVENMSEAEEEKESTQIINDDIEIEEVSCDEPAMEVDETDIGTESMIEETSAMERKSKRIQNANHLISMQDDGLQEMDDAIDSMNTITLDEEKIDLDIEELVDNEDHDEIVTVTVDDENDLPFEDAESDDLPVVDAINKELAVVEEIAVDKKEAQEEVTEEDICGKEEDQTENEQIEEYSEVFATNTDGATTETTIAPIDESVPIEEEPLYEEINQEENIYEVIDKVRPIYDYLPTGRYVYDDDLIYENARIVDDTGTGLFRNRSSSDSVLTGSSISDRISTLQQSSGEQHASQHTLQRNKSALHSQHSSLGGSMSSLTSAPPTPTPASSLSTSDLSERPRSHGKPHLAPKPPALGPAPAVDTRPSPPPKKLIVNGKIASRTQSMRVPRSPPVSPPSPPGGRPQLPPAPLNPPIGTKNPASHFGTLRAPRHGLRPPGVCPPPPPGAPPPPPARHASLAAPPPPPPHTRQNSAAEPAPPPPARGSSRGDLEARFGPLFAARAAFPAPDPFLRVAKGYSSATVSAKAQAPPPPLSVPLDGWAGTSSAC